MVLKPTIIGLSAIRPLPRRGNDGAENRPLSDFLQSVPSPRGRGLGRGQNAITLRKRRLKRWQQKIRITQTTKRKT